MVGQSRIKLKDETWCFFSPKENKYGRGDQQIRKTKSGFWKITGKPKPIMRNRQKIGEKKILMFYNSKESKSDWVIHEYHVFSPNQVLSVFLCYLLLLRIVSFFIEFLQMMMRYTLCKVMFKGGVREKSFSSPSSSGVSGIEQSRRDSLIPHLVNNSEVGSSQNFFSVLNLTTTSFAFSPFFRDPHFTEKIHVSLVMCSKKLQSRMLN